MSKGRIVVIGAGVAGLTTALLLAEASYDVTVVAKHMPGDYDIEYASPWAGANYMPVSVSGTREAGFDKETWPYLEQLARDRPEAGIEFQSSSIYNRAKDRGTATATWFAELLSPNPWFKNIIPDFRQLSQSELCEGADSGTKFTSVCINTAIYLPWLVSRCLERGVTFKRANLRHISDAVYLHNHGRADMVVNCSGLGAAKLGGVQDKLLTPARGQVVLVRNSSDGMYAASGTDDGHDEVVYVMKRPAGGGTILGGCYQKGSWESQPDPSLAIRIMKRAVEICPSLTQGKGIESLDVIRHGVGLRPLREGGPRIEREKAGGIWIVHNYGHGGYGYQSSYGCALAAKALVDKSFEPIAKL